MQQPYCACVLLVYLCTKKENLSHIVINCASMFPYKDNLNGWSMKHERERTRLHSKQLEMRSWPRKLLISTLFWECKADTHTPYLQLKRQFGVFHQCFILSSAMLSLYFPSLHMQMISIMMGMYNISILV